MNADLRILIARALNSSDLSPSDMRETDVDRVGAFAFADALGGALWSWKFARDPSAPNRAFALLLDRSTRVCRDSRMRGRLCAVALWEWHDDKCPRCRGRGSIAATATAPARACHVCSGSGRRPVSDLWRARELGLDRATFRKWEPRYNRVQRTIETAEFAVIGTVRRQLERRGIHVE